jgi:poly(A) polymerase/tRNA nucleotidyltransferase (CCA-adding enzyme)
MEPRATQDVFRLDTPPFVRFILKQLRQAGYSAYVVGGAVRNAWLHRPVTDWDVATSASPDEIRERFRPIRHFVLKHGTVTLVRGARSYEVTSFRGRGRTLREDLARRDFTLNAMAYDPDRKEIIDPHGGRDDLRGRRVRAVGDPRERFREDALRLLRAVRLAVQFAFRIEGKTGAVLKEMADRIHQAAPERIRDEFTKILMSPSPAAGLDLMRRTGLLGQVLPEILEGFRKQQDPEHRLTIYRHVLETVNAVPASPVLRWSALLHDLAKPRVRRKVDGEWCFPDHEKAGARLAASVLKRLRFSRAMTARITNLVAHHVIDWSGSWSRARVRRLIRSVGLPSIMDLLRLCRADQLAHGNGISKLKSMDALERRIIGEIEKGLVLGVRDLAIGGREVKQTLGISDGPEVGRILEALVEEVIADPALNTPDRLLSLLRRMSVREAHTGPKGE